VIFTEFMPGEQLALLGLTVLIVSGAIGIALYRRFARAR
jgi:hypothetical protein